MPYFVVCTFDLEDANSDDHAAAYVDLECIGLRKVVVGGTGAKRVMPTTTTAGTFKGANNQKVCTDVAEMVKKAFAARRFKSEIYVVSAPDAESYWFATAT